MELPENWAAMQSEARKQGKGIVYLLALEGGNYYIGWTADFAKRMHDHWTGCGAKFTQVHKPQKILMIRIGTTETEDIITDLCRKHWGKENVRGGRYMSPNYV